MAKFLGTPKVSTVLGLSDGIFAFLLIIAALAMFWVAEWAEKKFPIRRLLKFDVKNIE